MEIANFQCNEFLGCAFCPSNEKSIVTLSGEGDWCVILWNWESFKILARINLNVMDPLDTKTFQISMQNIMQD